MDIWECRWALGAPVDPLLSGAGIACLGVLGARPEVVAWLRPQPTRCSLSHVSASGGKRPLTCRGTHAKRIDRDPLIPWDNLPGEVEAKKGKKKSISKRLLCQGPEVPVGYSDRNHKLPRDQADPWERRLWRRAASCISRLTSALLKIPILEASSAVRRPKHCERSGESVSFREYISAEEHGKPFRRITLALQQQAHLVPAGERRGTFGAMAHARGGYI